MKKLYAPLIAVLCPLLIHAQIGWNFTASASPSSGIPVTNIALVSDITRANNNGTTTLVTTTSASNTYTGASGGGNAGAATRIGALITDTTGSAGSACFIFTLTPAPGAAISISEIDFGSRSTSTGPQQYDIRTSLDNYASPVASAVLLNGSVWAFHTNPLALTAAADQVITIRIYGYNGAGNASASTANWRIDDVSVTATASAGTTPPPPPVDPPQSIMSTAISGSEIDLTATGNAAGSNIVVAFNTVNIFGAPSGALVAGNTIAGGGTVLYSGSSAGFSFQHTGLTAGTAYYYSAWSVDGSNNYSTGLTTTATTNAPPPAHIVINQIYGGGGNSGATYKNDFIELFNDDNTPVNLAGWSLQYSSATGSGWASNSTPLSGIIPAHGFFLIQESAGAGGTLAVPAPDLTGTLALSATAGKVILSNSTTAETGTNPSDPSVIDKVGYGPTANGFETAPTAATDNTTAVIRVTDGVETGNNAADFVVAAPLPRNSLYTVTPPVLVSLNPPNGDTAIPANFIPSISFNKQIKKATGSITIIANGIPTTIDVNSPDIVISNNSTVTINTALAGGKSYSIGITAGAFTDVYGNNFAGLQTPADWAFTTFDHSVATTLPAIFDFQNCIGSGLLPNGFTQISVTGAQRWDCTPFGRDPNAPAGTAAFPNAVEINGFANNVNNLNEDWLISPKLNLGGTAFPLLSFWSRNAFAGAPLQLMISTDYNVESNDPSLFHWTALNGKFPSEGSDTWTQSANIDLSAFKQDSVCIAFVYTSTKDDGSRWTLDDISIINSLTPPPPSLTVSAANLEFGFKAGGTDTTLTLTVTGNDLTSDISLSATNGFLVSADGTNFGTTATLPQATANNVPQTVFVRFAPNTINGQFSGNLVLSISDSTDSITLKGNSIDPASTLSVVDWNLNWFGTPDPTLGPTDKALQEKNVGLILPGLHADLYALEEVVNEPALAAIVATMPGYAYVVGQYGSFSNPALAAPDPLNTVQKLAFVYNTAKIKNIRTDSLLTRGVTTAADLSTTYYNDWASGRFPYMLTADVSLSDNQGGTITKQMRFIDIHAKANTAPVVTAYNRRKDGAHALDSLIKANYSTDNLIVLGDFNDDLNQTITAGITPPASSYSAFTIDDSALYIFPTKPLSPAGQHSDVNFTSVIDNVIATDSVASFYLPGSATVLSDVGSLVSKYGTTTTDHYPVFTQYAFASPVPIPVDPFHLTAVKVGPIAKLTWTAERNIDTKQFRVERSIDGVKFTTIGLEPARGAIGTTSDYVFYDLLPVIGKVNDYRIEEVSNTGKSVFSSVVPLDFSGKLTMLLSPNPAHGSVTVTLDNAIIPILLQILDLNGRVMRQQLVLGNDPNIVLNLGGLAAGIYVVRAVGIQGVITQKLLVQ